MVAMKFRENAFLWLLAAAAVVALLAGATAGKETQGYFVAIRVVVCFASAYAAVTAYKAKRETWAWLLGANAALYNPFLLVRLSRDAWQLVDLVDIALVVAAAFGLRIREERLAAPAAAAVEPSAPKERTYRTPSRAEIALWLVLLALALGGAFLSQFYGTPEGATELQKQSHAQGIGAATVGLAFWGFLVAQLSRWRRPGRVALGCALAGLLTVFAGAAVGGYARGMERNEEMAAVLNQIGQFDPALASRLRAGKDSPGTSLPTLMRDALTRAIKQAPDDVVVTFAHQRYNIIQADNPLQLKRCVSALNGDGNIELNPREQLQMLHGMGNLFSAAATRIPPMASDADQRATLARLTVVYKQVDPDGVLDDDRKRAALSEQDQCALYTRLMQTLWTLPPRDAATAIRAMFAA
jgi:hypothetical protein